MFRPSIYLSLIHPFTHPYICSRGNVCCVVGFGMHLQLRMHIQSGMHSHNTVQLLLVSDERVQVAKLRGPRVN